MSQDREIALNKPNLICQALTELAHRRSLTLREEDALCMAKHALMLADKNKLETGK